MDTSHAALFDELVKIGEASEKPEKPKGFKNAVRHAGAGALGVGAGYAAGVGATKLIEHIRPGTIIPKKPFPGRGSRAHQVLTIGLPIGAGLSATLWSKYRQKMKEKLHGKASNGSG